MQQKTTRKDRKKAKKHELQLKREKLWKKGRKEKVAEKFCEARKKHCIKRMMDAAHALQPFFRGFYCAGALQTSFLLPNGYCIMNVVSTLWSAAPKLIVKVEIWILFFELKSAPPIESIRRRLIQRESGISNIPLEKSFFNFRLG